MKYFHDEVIIFNLLEFCFNLTGDATASVEELEDAYAVYREIIEDSLDLEHSNYNFDNILNECLEKHGDIFLEMGDYISICDDFSLDDAYELLVADFEDEVLAYDIASSDFIYNTRIMEALKITIDKKETSNYYDLAKLINSLFYVVAKKEYEHQDYKKQIKFIKYYDTKFRNMIADSLLNEPDYTKLRMSLALKYDDIDEEEYNFDWYLALLSNKTNLITTNMVANELEGMEMLADELGNDEDADYETLDDIVFAEDLDLGDEDIFITEEGIYFFANFLNKLHQYTLNYPSLDLLVRKYRLLSTYDLTYFKMKFLEDGNWDNLEIPRLEQPLPQSAFHYLFAILKEFSINFNVKDEKILANQSVYNDCVVKMLLIKNYLDLAIDEERKQDLINTLKNNQFYKMKDYATVSNLIDELVFSNNQILGK